MHHGTCVTHVPWCMSGSLTCGDGENVPGIPGACAPAILRIWQEAHADVLSIWPQVTHFHEISFKNQKFSFTKLHLKLSSAKYRPFWFSFNVINADYRCNNGRFATLLTFPGWRLIFWTEQTLIPGFLHHSDGTWTPSQTTGNATIYSTVCLDWHQRKHSKSPLLTLCEGNLLDSPHKGPVTRKASCMSWHHHVTLAGHQQFWYWQCKRDGYLSSLRKDFHYLCDLNVENWWRIQTHFYVPTKQFNP